MNSSLDTVSKADTIAQKTVYSILFSIAFAHLLNDLLQAVIPAAYPILKENFNLTFTQIGLITLAYQLAASILQPMVGLYTDKRPKPFSQYYIIWFVVVAILGLLDLSRIALWYQNHLSLRSTKKAVIDLPNLSQKTIVISVAILLVLIFSKFFYMSSMSSYFTFYLIEKFGISVQESQFHLVLFLASCAIGTLIGGPLGDKFGRKYVIWFSVLGAAPFTLMLPYVDLFWTGVLSIAIGIIISSAFPAILVYAQELLPKKLGMVSGLFYGFAFGMGGLGSALLGNLADHTSITYVYYLCAYLPLIGIIALFLPNLKKKVVH